MILYRYYVGRNKGLRSAGALKKDLIKERGKICYLCHNEHSNVELEHKIPVALGGKIFDKSNLELVCPRCHHKKTGTDKTIIIGLKGLKILDGSYQVDSLWTLGQLEEFYLKQFPIIHERKGFDMWDEKAEIIYINSNRGEADGRTD